MSRFHDGVWRLRAMSRRRLAYEWLGAMAVIVVSLGVLHRDILVPTLVGFNVAIGGVIVAVRCRGRGRSGER